MLKMVSNKLAYSLGEVCVCGGGRGGVKAVSMKDSTSWMIQCVFTVIIIINIFIIIEA